MLPLTAHANERPIEDRTQEIFEGALEVCEQDTARALYLVSMKTAELLDNYNILESENEVCVEENLRLNKLVGEDDESFFKKAWDSNITKMLIFGVGIYAGYQLAD